MVAYGENGRATTLKMIRITGFVGLMTPAMFLVKIDLLKKGHRVETFSCVCMQYEVLVECGMTIRHCVNWEKLSYIFSRKTECQCFSNHTMLYGGTVFWIIIQIVVWRIYIHSALQNWNYWYLVKSCTKKSNSHIIRFIKTIWQCMVWENLRPNFLQRN